MKRCARIRMAFRLAVDVSMLVAALVVFPVLIALDAPEWDDETFYG